MDYPSVTIITPVYNAVGYIRETIESVLNQDYPNLEYIILNDGSTDDSCKIIQEYTGRARIFSHPNMGHPQSVNKGFRLAKGDILSIVNADDPLRPDSIKILVQAMIDDPEIVAVYPDWDLIDNEGNIMQAIRGKDYDFAYMVNWHKCLPGPGVFFRKSVLDQVPGWNEEYRYVYDFEFWLRAGLVGLFKHVNQNLASFRWHKSSKSAGQQGRWMAAEHVRLMRNFFDLPGVRQRAGLDRRQAMSSAYYIGGTVAGSDVWLKKYYYLRAYLLAPQFYQRPEEKDRADQIRFWLLEHSRNSLFEPVQKGFQKVRSLVRRLYK